MADNTVQIQYNFPESSDRCGDWLPLKWLATRIDCSYLLPSMEQPNAASMGCADDRAALRVVAREAGAGLCTIVGIEGSFSRRLGAQLAVHADGTVTGSLADGCLERQLAAEIAKGGERRILRFGAGSPMIDFRLPCGSGLDILIDPDPDRSACRGAVRELELRREATLNLEGVPDGLLQTRQYMPALQLALFGEGPELAALAGLACSAGIRAKSSFKDDPALAIGRRPEGLDADRWTAVALLFHDHEWEQAILEWALASPAFFIGAQGGRQTREERQARLHAAGYSNEQVGRVHSPLGVIKHSREPLPLALTALAQIVGEYERMHPHG